MADVTITGGDGVYGRITGVVRRTAAPGPSVWRSLGSYLRREWAEQIRSEGAHFHTPWKPLKPKYATWKANHGYGARGILVQTGDLRKSFTQRGASMEHIEGSSAVFGSTHKLAPFHQYGTRSHSTGKRVIPARPVVVVTPELKSEVKRIIADYVAGKK